MDWKNELFTFIVENEPRYNEIIKHFVPKKCSKDTILGKKLELEAEGKVKKKLDGDGNKRYYVPRRFRGEARKSLLAKEVTEQKFNLIEVPRENIETSLLIQKKLEDRALTEKKHLLDKIKPSSREDQFFQDIDRRNRVRRNLDAIRIDLLIPRGQKASPLISDAATFFMLKGLLYSREFSYSALKKGQSFKIVLSYDSAREKPPSEILQDDFLEWLQHFKKENISKEDSERIIKLRAEFKKKLDETVRKREQWTLKVIERESPIHYSRLQSILEQEKKDV